MSTESGGLASAAQIEALADQMSHIADEIHKRIMKDIGAHHGGPVSEQDQAVARALLEDELLLRQRADGLYAEAATYVVRSLAVSQQQLMALTAAAAEKIRTIDRIASVTGLIGGVLRLVGAIATGHPVPIVAAIERLSKQVKLVKASG
ncbi:hypothetical protein LP419_05215 [Massilia sp. H-1]|nr:hypothetical protein LP419_05215 [Massilia sp. H-1]